MGKAMDPTQSFSAFVRCFEAGSFSAVAREMGVSQSSVSKQIASLEANLGVQLFARTTRRLQPTAEALDLYDHVRHLLDSIETLRSARGQRATASGTLKVTMPSAYGRQQICPKLPGFIEQNPLVNVEVMLTDTVVNLVEEGFELAIRVGPLSASTLMARPLGTVDQVLVATPDYLAEHRAPESPTDLAEHRCLIYGGASQPSRWEFESDMGRHVANVAGPFRVNDHEVLYDLVSNHQGIGLIPDWMADDPVTDGRLISLLPDYYPIPLPVNIVYPQTRFISLRARQFIDYMVAACKQ